MAEATVELKVPAAIYEMAEAIANETTGTAESVLVEGLAMLFSPDPDNVEDPDKLSGFSDEKLWMIVQQRLTPKQESRVRELADRGNRGELNDLEIKEIESWVTRVDHQMLLRSRALLLLKRRGHDIDQYFETAI